MLRIHPFVMGHLIGAVMTGAIAGAFIGPQAAFMAALILLAGAVASCLICQWWPGVEAPVWKLWPVAVLANPVLIASFGFMVVDWECVAGTRRGLNCLPVAMAMVTAGLCLLPPVGGLLWRWWKRRRAPAA
jgi:cell division protein FtsX